MIVTDIIPAWQAYKTWGKSQFLEKYGDNRILLKVVQVKILSLTQCLELIARLMLKIMDNLFDKINFKYNIKLAVYMCAAILMTLKRHHSEKLILFFLLKT